MKTVAIVSRLFASTCLLSCGSHVAGAADREARESPFSLEAQVRPRDVRVLIVAGADALRIRSTTPTRIVCRIGEKQVTLPARTEINLFVARNAIRVEGTDNEASEVIVQASPGVPLQLSSSRGSDLSPAILYPGAFRIMLEDDHLRDRKSVV